MGRYSLPSSGSTRRRVRAFALGRWFVAPEAREARLPGDVVLECFRRHARGDFGDIGPAAFEANLDSIAMGGPIVSEYRYEHLEIRLITAADRSATTLYVSEY